MKAKKPLLYEEMAITKNLAGKFRVKSTTLLAYRQADREYADEGHVKCCQAK